MDMMTSSNGNIFRVTGPLWGEFTDHRWIPLTKPVTWSFDVFFDLRLNRRLNKSSRRRWFDAPLHSLWRHCNELLWFSMGLPEISRVTLTGMRMQMTRIESYHYNDVIMGPIASQITSLTIVYSIVYSDADQRKHQSSASLAFVWGIHRGPLNSLHKWPVTRKMFPIRVTS